MSTEPLAEGAGAASGGPGRAAAAADRADARAQLANELRAALGEMLRAERKLRSRDPKRPGALSYAQVRALVLLDDIDEATAGQLAKAADLTPASVTAMLDQLEEQGMVERRRSETDRRLVVVSLTAEGRALLEHKRANWLAHWDEAMGDLPEAEIRTSIEVLHRMARMFDRF
ncbi:MarR family winged helix-turn-helix transcriptional regulator [Conexibacter sp. CPCC 206217]|uniref:MarR family winged helix-turn-helix transcriptional regulator n=1 Tax=Conexibacter sp. CPCC 206217 TaxID=3064574 RepID=UPI002724C806|nr:MarR family transcriptional regulator [Conexibacter sp. CPCC 206217]MDO8210581.1 MarR family transcriptional regulator [Conexibacter sp. CPCC 206217]